MVASIDFAAARHESEDEHEHEHEHEIFSQDRKIGRIRTLGSLP
jgi:hypothetical protein